MKKLLTGLFLSGVLATGLFAQDGAYFCMAVKAVNGDTVYKYSKKEMEDSIVKLTIKEHVLSDGENNLTYQYTKNDIDVYMDKGNNLAVGFKTEPENDVYIADIAKKNSDNVIILACQKIK